MWRWIAIFIRRLTLPQPESVFQQFSLRRLPNDDDYGTNDEFAFFVLDSHNCHSLTRDVGQLSIKIDIPFHNPLEIFFY
jgi:hypothetical protein